MPSNVDSCPSCNVSFIGEPIPENIKHHYAGTHWRREIGIEISELYDGVAYWKCPDCKHIWKRFPWVPDYNGS